MTFKLQLYSDRVQNVRTRRMCTDFNDVYDVLAGGWCFDSCLVQATLVPSLPRQRSGFSALEPGVIFIPHLAETRAAFRTDDLH